MSTASISATELKRNASDVLNRVYYGKRTMIVERHGEPIVKIVPFEKERSTSSLKKSVSKYFGILPDFPDVTKARRSRQRPIRL